MKELYIDILDEASVKAALKAIYQYRTDIQKKQKEFMRELQALGYYELQSGWKGGQVQYDGEDNTTFKVTKTENGFELTANGDSVCFIEFGSGVFYASDKPYPVRRPPGVMGIGRYRLEGKGPSKGANNFWFYSGKPGTNGVVVHTHSVMTHGNPANAVMYKTAQKMRNELIQIAKKVYSK